MKIVAVLVTACVLAGCGSSGTSAPFGPRAMGAGQTSQTEVAQLCDMHRRMAGMTPEAQEALLESHMQAAHGSSNAQMMAMHRQAMLQHCAAR